MASDLNEQFQYNLMLAKALVQLMPATGKIVKTNNSPISMRCILSMKTDSTYEYGLTYSRNSIKHNKKWL
jgi:hypothetical protein